MKSFSFKTFSSILFILIVFSSYSSASSFNPQPDIPRGPYYIQSAQDFGKSWYGCWDIHGVPTKFKNGQNIQVWGVTKQDSKKRDRSFYILKNPDGTYGIRSGLHPYAHRVDVAGGKSNNGTNILLWQKNNGQNQKFRFRYMGNGKWKIYTMTGRIICLANRSSKNGSNVHIWADHDGPWCEWVLVNKYSLKAFVPNKRSSRPASKTNISLYQACRDTKTNKGAVYFATVTYSQFKKDNKKRSIHSIVDSMKPNKAVLAIQKLLSNAKASSKTLVRNGVYGELNKINLTRLKKNFGNRLLLAIVKTTAQKQIKTEKNSYAKRQLRKLADNL